jgi:hypothetical protein
MQHEMPRNLKRYNANVELNQTLTRTTNIRDKNTKRDTLSVISVLNGDLRMRVLNDDFGHVCFEL